MDENLHNIDDLFKKAINEYDEMPSKNVWEQIDKNLDKKKVVSISEKYNKLKWVAAALLIFSAGMAMYTLRTNVRNTELVQKNTVNSKKQDENLKFNKNNYINNDTDKASIAEVEKKALTEVTAPIIKQNNDIDLPEVHNTTESRDAKKNYKKVNKAETESAPVSKKQLAIDFIAKSDPVSKNAEKNKRIIKEGFVKIKENDSDEKPVLKDDELISRDKRQKDYLNKKLALLEKTHKEVALDTELQQHNFESSPGNISLQHLLQNLSINKNKIVTEKSAAVNPARSKIKNVKKTPFSATLFYSPDFVSSKVNNNHHSFREEDRNEIKNKEDIKNAYTTGLLIGYNTGKKFSIESGLTFSSMTTAIEPKTIFARPDPWGSINYRFNCSYGYSFIPSKSGNVPAAGDSIHALSSKNTLQYIGVPFMVKYNVSKGKWALHPGAGIAVNFLTKGKIETGIARSGGAEKANLNHIEGLKPSYIYGSVSLGANYNLNQNIAFAFTPSAKFALTSINKNAPVKTYLNSIGLAAGLMISP